MSDVIDNDTGEVTIAEPMEISGAVAAEISQQVATAKRYPRRSDKAISQEILSRATLDEETAAECTYSLPRAGKNLTGPSVRFAEIVFASFGNMRAGARFVELDTKDPARAAVIIEGVCIDMQMNNGQTVPVRRSITGRKGIFNADMTNIAFSAGAAIARREAILKTVPKSIWGFAYKAVIAVLQGDAKTLSARRRSAIEAFERMGVQPGQVFKALEVEGEETITIEHMPRLLGMWTALRDGTETIESLFGAPAPDVVKNPLRDHPDDSAAPKAAAAGPKPETEAPKPAVESPAPRQQRAANRPNLMIDADGNFTAGVPFPEGDKVMIVDARFEETDFTSLAEWLGSCHDAGLATEPASNEGAKSDMPAAGPDKAAGAAPAPEAAKVAPAQESAQAAPKTPATGQQKPYEDAAGYIAFMQDLFDQATTSGTITEAWGGTRADRSELLSPEQITALTNEKAAKLAAIKLKGAK